MDSSGLPRLPCYRQSAIRWQKAHDLGKALFWAERGLEVYGASTVPANVEDLQKRAAQYREKIAKSQSEV